MVGKICRAVYAYQAQNSDEIEMAEEEQLTIVNAVDRDWVTAHNAQGQVGYVPAAYLEIIGDAPPIQEYEDVATTETYFETSHEASVEETPVVRNLCLHCSTNQRYLPLANYYDNGRRLRSGIIRL